jgi:hypothetical protein
MQTFNTFAALAAANGTVAYGSTGSIPTANTVYAVTNNSIADLKSAWAAYKDFVEQPWADEDLDLDSSGYFDIQVAAENAFVDEHQRLQSALDAIRASGKPIPDALYEEIDAYERMRSEADETHTRFLGGIQVTGEPITLS